MNPRELTPQRVRVLAISAFVLAALTVWRLVLAPVPGVDGAIPEFSGSAFGTSWLVKVDAELADGDRAEIRAAIEAELERVDTLMSTWREDSQLSGLNAAPANEPFPVDAETFEVLEISRRVSEATEGAFDVTVGPLVRIWGFGAGAAAPEPPSDDVLAEARERVGYGMLVMDAAGSSVTKTRGDLYVDLSATAKGYAIDRVAAGLEALGYTSYLVEVGGELRAGAAKSDGSPWRVAVEEPDARTRTMYGVLEMTGEGVATSGDYRNFYEIDGVRYAHLIDPRTARPVAHSGVSVTVVAPSAALADAWATALSVLGPQEGFEVAEAEGLTALFIWIENDGVESRATSSMEARAPVSLSSEGA